MNFRELHECDRGFSVASWFCGLCYRFFCELHYREHFCDWDWIDEPLRRVIVNRMMKE